MRAQLVSYGAGIAIDPPATSSGQVASDDVWPGAAESSAEPHEAQQQQHKFLTEMREKIHSQLGGRLSLPDGASDEVLRSVSTQAVSGARKPIAELIKTLRKLMEQVVASVVDKAYGEPRLMHARLMSQFKKDMSTGFNVLETQLEEMLQLEEHGLFTLNEDYTRYQLIDL